MKKRRKKNANDKHVWPLAENWFRNFHSQYHHGEPPKHPLLVLVGPSGCGKTFLIRWLACCYGIKIHFLDHVETDSKILKNALKTLGETCASPTLIHLEDVSLLTDEHVNLLKEVFGSIVKPLSAGMILEMRPENVKDYYRFKSLPYCEWLNMYSAYFGMCRQYAMHYLPTLGDNSIYQTIAASAHGDMRQVQILCDWINLLPSSNKLANETIIATDVAAAEMLYRFLKPDNIVWENLTKVKQQLLSVPRVLDFFKAILYKRVTTAEKEDIVKADPKTLFELLLRCYRSSKVEHLESNLEIPDHYLTSIRRRTKQISNTMLETFGGNPKRFSLYNSLLVDKKDKKTSGSTDEKKSCKCSGELLETLVDFANIQSEMDVCPFINKEVSIFSAVVSMKRHFPAKTEIPKWNELSQWIRPVRQKKFYSETSSTDSSSFPLPVLDDLKDLRIRANSFKPSS